MKDTTSNDIEQKIAKLQYVLDMLKKRKIHFNKIIAKLICEAKAKITLNDKLGALCCIKKKKLYESQIEKINDNSHTLQLQITTLQFEKCKKNEISHEKIVFDIFSNTKQKQNTKQNKKQK